jgi:shikimate kinase
LYEERVPLYNKYADVVISEEHLNIEQTVQKLSETVRQLKSNPKM